MDTRVGGIYAELTLDDSRFQTRLTNAEQGFTGLRGAAQRAAAEVDRSFTNTGTSIERGGLGARAAAQDIDRVGRAAQSAARDVDRIERSADEAAQATRRIEVPAGLANAARRASEAIGSIGERATGAASTGSQMGDSFVGGFASRLQGLGGKGGPIAMALVGVAGIGLAAGAVLAKAISDGMEQEKDRDLIQARLGIPDDIMREIGTAAGNAFANGWGESAKTNMETIQAAIQGGLLSGEETAGEMQPLVEKLTAVNDLIGGDIQTTVKATRSLIKNGLAADSAEAFDIIVRGFQRGGDVGDDLVDTISEYGNGWKNTGFSGQFAIGLVTQALENGVDVADRAGDAIREFGRRMYEETDTIKETLTGLDLPAEELIDQLKKGGPVAEAAFDQIFDAIRKVEDPLERNEATMALLGDTAGDFIDAFGQWDPSRAVAGLGDVAGAAENAMQVMGSNSAAHMAAAKNSITNSMDEVKFAIAEAFGPTLQQAADWVSTHKPEIIAFFVNLADAGLATLDGLISFASGALRAFASMQEGIGNTLGKSLEVLGNFSSKIGGIIKHIPGMEDTGKALETGGDAASWYGEQMDGAADKAKALADALDSTRPKIDSIRDSVHQAGEQAVHAAEMTRLFGGAVTAVPDGKSVLVEALTDEAKGRLEEFGFKVESLPDGTSRITANTADGQRMIDDFINANEGRKVTLSAELAAEINTHADNIDKRWSRADGGIDIDHSADGELPDQATIKPGQLGLVQWAEPETGGEAYIPLAASKRSRSTAILADVANRFGYDLLRFAKGGLHGEELASQSQGIEGAEYVWGGWTDSWNTDCSGAASRIANLAVYGDPMVGGRFSTADEGTALAARGFQDGPGPEGSLRIGWVNDPKISGGGHTAVTLPNGTNVEMGGPRGNGQYGGRAAGALDFPNVMHLLMDPPSIGEGSGGIPADRAAEAAASKELTSTVKPASSGSVQDVRVINWPESLGGQPAEERQPIATLNARWFADGTEDHTAQVAPPGDLRVWGEPETGGEAYIPLSAAKRARSTAILASVANRFGLRLTRYAMGGFGGLGQDGDDGVHTGSWEIVTRGQHGNVPLSTPRRDVPLAVWSQAAYRAAAFGAGLALTAASGWDSSGKFQGFDTSNTSIPGLDDALSQVSELLERIAAAAEAREPVQVDVDVDSGRRTAELNIRQFGV